MNYISLPSFYDITDRICSKYFDEIMNCQKSEKLNEKKIQQQKSSFNSRVLN